MRMHWTTVLLVVALAGVGVCTPMLSNRNVVQCQPEVEVDFANTDPSFQQPMKRPAAMGSIWTTGFLMGQDATPDFAFATLDGSSVLVHSGNDLLSQSGASLTAFNRAQTGGLNEFIVAAIDAPPLAGALFSTSNSPVSDGGSLVILEKGTGGIFIVIEESVGVWNDLYNTADTWEPVVVTGALPDQGGAVVKVGDFDGDSIMDVMYLTSANEGKMYWTQEAVGGGPTGTWLSNPHLINVFANHTALADAGAIVVDFNADGVSDVIAATTDGSTTFITLFLNNGGGVDFQVFLCGRTHNTVPLFDVGDLDGTGLPDIIYYERDFHQLKVVQYATASLVDPPVHTISLAHWDSSMADDFFILDMYKDSTSEVILTGGGVVYVAEFLGWGDPSLQLSRPVPLNAETTSISIMLPIELEPSVFAFLTFFSSDTIDYLLLPSLDKSFIESSPNTLNTWNRASKIPAGATLEFADPKLVDLDLDGDLDVVVRYSTSSTTPIVWYRNTDGLGSLDPDSSSPTPSLLSISTRVAAATCYSLDVGDVDGDGDSDIVAAMFESGSGTIAVFINDLPSPNLAPDWTAYSIHTMGSTRPDFVRLAHLDSAPDGYMDVLFAYRGSGSVWGWNGLINKWVASSIGTEWSLVNGTTYSNQVVGIEAGPISFDVGSPYDDIVVCTTHTAYMIRNSHVSGPFGAFGSAYTTANLGGSASICKAKDVNGDGVLDVFSMRNAILVGVLSTTGGTAVAPAYAGSAQLADLFTDTLAWLEVADFNGDGNDDIVFTSDSGSTTTFRVLEGNGLGAFGTMTTVGGYTDTGGNFGLGDMDRDGDLDVVISLDRKLSVAANLRRWAFSKYHGVSPPLSSVDVCRSHAGFPSVVSASCLAAAIGQTSHCVTSTVLLSGVSSVQGWATHPIRADHSVEIVGGGMNATRLVAAGSPVLVVKDAGAARFSPVDVTLRNLMVTGAAAPNSDLFGDSGLWVDGEPSRTSSSRTLHLDHVHLNGSRATFGGGALALGSFATVTLRSTRVTDCTAAEAGGGVFANEGATVSLTDVVFERNTALGSAGGAVGISANIRAGAISVTNAVFSDNSASTAGGSIAFGVEVGDPNLSTAPPMVSILHLDNVTMRGSRAGEAGGALAVLGRSGNKYAALEVQFSNGGSVKDAQAPVGAAVYCASFSYQVTSISVPSDLGRSGLSPGSRTVSWMGPQLWNAQQVSASVVGGAFFSCGCDLNGIPTMSRITGAYAELAGAVGFACDVASRPVSTASTAGYAEAAAVGSLGYGPGWATPPVGIGVSPPLTETPSGLPLTDYSAILLDGFGTGAIEPGATMTVDVAAGSGTAVRGDTELGYLGNGSFTLQPASVTLTRVGNVPFVPGPTSLILAATLPGSGQGGKSLQITLDNVQVMLCPEGTGSIDVSQDNLLVCAKCGLGFESKETSAEPCTIVRPCPENMVLETLNNGSCVCKDAFWSPPGFASGELGCLACPPGGVCTEGLALPRPKTGFYPDGPGRFLECMRPKACVGSLTSPCAPSSSGYLCNTCSSGHFSNVDKECEACPSSSSVAAAFYGAIVVVVVCGVAVGAVMGRFMDGHEASVGVSGGGLATTESIRAFRAHKLPGSVSMVVVAFQMVALIVKSNLAWTSGSRAVFGSIAFLANAEFSVFATQCAVSSFAAAYTVNLLIPLGGILVVMVTLLVLRAVGMFEGLSSRSVGSVLDAVVFTLAPLVYLPVSSAAFVMFDCVPLPNGKYVVDSDPGELCFEGSWWSLFPLGALVCVGFVLGLPSYFAWALVRNRESLFEPHVISRYGSLYRLYRRAYYWGAVANLLKRLALVVAAVFFSQLQLAQLSIMVFVLVGWLTALSYLQPYYNRAYTVADYRLTLVVMTVLVLGTAQYAERGNDSPSTFFVIASVVVLVVLVAVSVHAIAVDVARIRRMRHSPHLPAEERLDHLGKLVKSELMDVEADGELLRAAGQFLAAFGNKAGARDSTAYASTMDIEMTPCDAP